MGARKMIHDLVEKLPEDELGTARDLLDALNRKASASELEDSLDAYELRRLRVEQAKEPRESLEAFGKRMGLE